MDAAVSRQKAMGVDLETIEDFGIAQAEAGDRAIRESAQSNIFGPGQTLFDITQATVCPIFRQRRSPLMPRIDHPCRSLLYEGYAVTSLFDVGTFFPLDESNGATQQERA